MGGQGPVPGEGQKGPQGLLLGGGPLQHLVGDPGEVDDLRGQDTPRGDKGVEPVGDLPVPQDDGADLDDDLILFVQACGLDVKTDDLVREGGVRLSVDHHPVVHVVEVVGLHPVEELDLLGRVPGVREGLGHPVVGDGNGRVAPGLRPLDHVPVRPQLGHHRGEGVHGGHGGVQVELHPLLRRVVLLHGPLRGHDRHRLHHHIPVEAVHVQPALHLQVHSLLDAVHQGLALVPGEEFADADGVGVVGQVEGHHPGPPLLQLPVVHGEHVALHHHRAHVQLQIPDGDGRLGDGLAKDGLALGGLLPPVGRGSLLGAPLTGRPADSLGAGKGVVLRGGGGLLPARWLRRHLGGGDGLDPGRAQPVGPAHRLLHLGQQIGTGTGGPLHHQLRAPLPLVDGGGHDQPALRRLGQLAPAAKGGKHL